MIAFWFVVGAALVGALLYLPFHLWFRFSRRGRREVAASERLTPRSTVGNAVLVLAMLGAFAWYQAGDGPDIHVAMRHGVLVKLWLAFCVLNTLLVACTRGSQPLPLPDAPASDPSPDGPPPIAPVSPGSTPPGFFRAATFGSVPVLVHWRFLLSGAVIAMLAGADLDGLIAYCAAYAGVFAIHEAAHALAAWRLGIRVHAIVLLGHGGRCVVRVPRSARDTFQVYVAGVAAQAVLLAATLTAVAVLGEPETAVGAAVVMTFTWVNAMLIVVNLVPAITRQGLPTDGAILWQLYRHVRHGQAHPLEVQHAVSPVFDPSTPLLTVAGMRPEGFVAGIELLNDDTTPMEFVVEMLERHAVLDRDAAVALMLDIHRRGGLLLPQPTLAVAEVIADAITRDARARGHVLVCRAVSAAP